MQGTPILLIRAAHGRPTMRYVRSTMPSSSVIIERGIAGPPSAGPSPRPRWTYLWNKQSHISLLVSHAHRCMRHGLCHRDKACRKLRTCWPPWKEKYFRRYQIILLFSIFLDFSKINRVTSMQVNFLCLFCSSY